MRTADPAGTAAALDVARRGFGLAVEEIRPVPAWNSTVFRLTTHTGTYALRARTGSARAVRRELAFLRHLAAAGLAVPEPLTAEPLTVDGVHHDVTTWLDGAVRRRGLDAAAAHRLGAAIAAIHRAGRSFAPEPVPEAAGPGDPVELLAAPALDPGAFAGHLGPEDVNVLARAVAAARRLPIPAATGMLHLDLIFGNCVWRGEEVGVLDFAECRPGPYAYDLAPMLTNLSGEPDLRTALLAGYRTAMPLSAADEAALPVLEAVRHVSACVRIVDRHRRGVHGPPPEVHLPWRVAEIRALLDA